VSETVLSIYNKAIAAVGGKALLSSTGDTALSRELCDLYYPGVVRLVFSAAHWPFCRQVARLSLLAERDSSVDWEPSAPDPEYTYSYALPNDLLRPWYLTNFDYFRLSFNTAHNRQTLNTNVANAVLIYAAEQPNPAFWEPGAVEAIVHGLAAAIAPKLTGDRGKQTLELQIADRALEVAAAHAANFDKPLTEYIPEELRARGYESAQTPTLYYYPLGSNFAASYPNA
jgi:hypothetical protein